MSNPKTIRENADIRTWAANRGFELNPTGRIPVAIRRAYENAQNGTDPEEPGYHGPVDVDPGPEPVTDPGPEPAETRPAEIKPERRDDSETSDPGASVSVLRPPEKKPEPVTRPRGIAKIRASLAGADGKGKRKRTSLARVVGSTWGLAARVMASSPASIPVARVLQLQAPVAGVIVDRLAKDTIVDRVMQPLARMSEKSDTIMALVGPPLLVAAISHNPDNAQFLAPLLRESLTLWIDIAGPELEKMRKREEARKASGIDLDELIEAFFAPGDFDNVESDETSDQAA